MKILSIRLKNLASIEGPYEINFMEEPLKSAGIFAIAGSTGAGKSTILDALCLALYDKAPRFASSNESLLLKDMGDSRINQNDVRNILRRGTGEGFAEVLFESVTGRRYRSKWHVRRARNKATGSLQAQSILVSDEDTGEELQGTKTELLSQLTTLIGLTYDQFTRTVLLAQNDFATFLKSKESAKAELLEKLTGTDVYSKISRIIYQKCKAATESYTLLKTHLGLIELLPDEEIQILQSRKKELQTEVTELSKQLSALNDKLKIIHSLNRQEELLSARQKDEQTQQVGLQQLVENHFRYAQEYDQFKKQCASIQPDIMKARELDILINGKEIEFKKNELSYREILQNKNEVEKAVNNKKSKLVSKDQLQEYEDNLAKLEIQLKSSSIENEDRVDKLNTFQINRIGEEQEHLNNKQKELQHTRQNTIEWLKLQQEIEELLKQQSAHLENGKKLEEELHLINRQHIDKKEQAASLKRVYDQARIAIGKDVKELRQNLTPGVECPVCGSKEHPYSAESQIESLYQNIEKEYTTVASALQEINNRIIILERDMRHNKEQSKSISGRLFVAQKELAEKTPKQDCEKEVAYFDIRLESLQNRLNELTEKLRDYQKLYQEWYTKNEEINQWRIQTEKIKETITSSHLSFQQVEALKAQLTHIMATETAEYNRYTLAKNELDELRKQRGSLLKGKTAEDAELSIRRKEKDWNDVLERSKKEMDERKNHLSVLQGEIKQLMKYIEDLTKEKDSINSSNDLLQTITEKQILHQDAERKLSETETRLVEQDKNRKKLIEFEQELKEKQTIAERWEKLNELIGSADGTKFKVIAQSYTLNLLLLHANKHLSYLSKRYKLQQVPDTLALQVIDRDMCDEIRTVYSLSGGESFLISLSLALGLSSLSSNNLKIESLFIDEGFGSLDAESLRQAMDALEQLRIQGRKIGVISHVHEMSERIPVKIQVDKLVNGKSNILIKN